jgi:hypothetical protein
MHLPSTTSTLSITAGAGATTYDLQVHAGWTDYSSDGKRLGSGAKNTVIDAAGTTEIVPAPPTGVTRTIEHIYAYSGSDAQHNVAAIIDDGTSECATFAVDLDLGEVLQYDHESGFATYDTVGRRKLSNSDIGYATKRTVEAHTGDDTLLASETGSIHTSYGAAGTVVLTLPAAVVGLEFFFVVGAAQELRLDPSGTETISLPSTGAAGGAGKDLTANAAGESVHLVCVSAGTWAAFGFTGTWTAQP